MLLQSCYVAFDAVAGLLRSRLRIRLRSRVRRCSSALLRSYCEAIATFLMPLRSRCEVVAKLLRSSCEAAAVDKTISRRCETTRSGSRSLGRRVPVVTALPWAQPAARIANHITCASLTGRPLHFFDADTSNGTPMMRKAHGEHHLRIIGRPSASAAEIRRGLSMIRFPQRSCAYRIIGMPSRRFAHFCAGLPMMRLAKQDVVYRIIGRPFVHLASFLA